MTTGARKPTRPYDREEWLRRCNASARQRRLLTDEEVRNLLADAAAARTSDKPGGKKRFARGESKRICDKYGIFPATLWQIQIDILPGLKAGDSS